MEGFANVFGSLDAKPKPQSRRTIREVLIDFYYMCTAHGISHAANARNRTLRIFWIFVFIVCFIIMCIQIYLILQKFLQYPKIVEVDLKAFSSKIARSRQSRVQQTRQKRQASGNVTEPEILPLMSPTRFYPVYSDCVCEMNEVGKLSPGSCIPAFKGTLGKDFENFVYPRNRYRKSVCICDYDQNYRSPWPCYPSIAWESKMCIHCAQSGHCPMRFWEPNEHVGVVYRCLCHDDFNLCVVDLGTDIPSLTDQHDLGSPGQTVEPLATTTTTTPAPEVMEALGFDVQSALL